MIFIFTQYLWIEIKMNNGNFKYFIFILFFIYVKGINHFLIYSGGWLQVLTLGHRWHVRRISGSFSYIIVVCHVAFNFMTTFDPLFHWRFFRLYWNCIKRSLYIHIATKFSVLSALCLKKASEFDLFQKFQNQNFNF